jgi:hypothetical protein
MAQSPDRGPSSVRPGPQHQERGPALEMARFSVDRGTGAFILRLLSLLAAGSSERQLHAVTIGDSGFALDAV